MNPVFSGHFSSQINLTHAGIYAGSLSGWSNTDASVLTMCTCTSVFFYYMHHAVSSLSVGKCEYPQEQVSVSVRQIKVGELLSHLLWYSISIWGVGHIITYKYKIKISFTIFCHSQDFLFFLIEHEKRYFAERPTENEWRPQLLSKIISIWLWFQSVPHKKLIVSWKLLHKCYDIFFFSLTALVTIHFNC